jgi:hypothetical protein
VDDRVAVMLAKVDELRAGRALPDAQRALEKSA